jgi:hypothetical protein
MRLFAMLACVAGLLVATTARAQDAAPEIKVSKYGKVYANPDLTLQMVSITGSKGILARFSGSPAEEETIDGRVLQYDAIAAGSGIDYRGRGKGGIAVNRMHTREAMGEKVIEVFMQGKTYRLTYDEKASKALETAALLDDYKSTRSKPGP